MQVAEEAVVVADLLERQLRLGGGEFPGELHGRGHVNSDGRRRLGWGLGRRRGRYRNTRRGRGLAGVGEEAQIASGVEGTHQAVGEQGPCVDLGPHREGRAARCQQAAQGGAAGVGGDDRLVDQVAHQSAEDPSGPHLDEQVGVGRRSGGGFTETYGRGHLFDEQPGGVVAGAEEAAGHRGEDGLPQRGHGGGGQIAAQGFLGGRHEGGVEGMAHRKQPGPDACRGGPSHHRLDLLSGPGDHGLARRVDRRHHHLVRFRESFGGRYVGLEAGHRSETWLNRSERAAARLQEVSGLLHVEDPTPVEGGDLAEAMPYGHVGFHPTPAEGA